MPKKMQYGQCCAQGKCIYNNRFSAKDNCFTCRLFNPLVSQRVINQVCKDLYGDIEDQATDLLQQYGRDLVTQAEMEEFCE